MFRNLTDVPVGMIYFIPITGTLIQSVYSVSGGLTLLPQFQDVTSNDFNLKLFNLFNDNSNMSSCTISGFEYDYLNIPASAIQINESIKQTMTPVIKYKQ